MNSNCSYSPEILNSGKKLAIFVSHVTFKFDRWPLKTIGHVFYTISSFLHHFKAICEFKLELQHGNTQFWSNRWFFVPCNLQIWWMNSKHNREPLLCSSSYCASTSSNWKIQTGVTVQKRPIWVKIDNLFSAVCLEIWQMNLKNNRAPLLGNTKLCTSFHHHMWIQIGVRSGNV